MKENQLFIDKATALFWNLHQLYGFGKIYQSVIIPSFRHRFEFTNIRIKDWEFSIGILHQRLLTTVIFCKDIDSFKTADIGTIVYILYAGKLAPRDSRDYHPSVMKLIHDGKNSYIEGITAQEIISYLGQMDLESQPPKDINKTSLLEILFNEEAKIKRIKKG